MNYTIRNKPWWKFDQQAIISFKEINLKMWFAKRWPFRVKTSVLSGNLHVPMAPISWPWCHKYEIILPLAIMILIMIGDTINLATKLPIKSFLEGVPNIKWSWYINESFFVWFMFSLCYWWDIINWEFRTIQIQQLICAHVYLQLEYIKIKSEMFMWKQ